MKLSTITGKHVNENNFNGSVKIFSFNTKNKSFSCNPIISNYLYDNYSNKFFGKYELLEEVINEYDEYKDYKW